jgi:hypothetical protein
MTPLKNIFKGKVNLKLNYDTFCLAPIDFNFHVFSKTLGRMVALHCFRCLTEYGSSRISVILIVFGHLAEISFLWTIFFKISCPFKEIFSMKAK